MPPTSLLTLPDEILLAIFENFCPYCFILPDEDIDDEWRKYGLTISSLEQTCRRLRDIVQLVRWHYAYDGNLTGLLCVMIWEPELAAQIRILYTLGNFDDLEPSGEDMEIFEAEARRLDIRNCGQWNQAMLNDKTTLYFRLLELALALLPGVKELSITLPSNLSPRAEMLLQAPFAMKSVRRLSLRPWESVDLGLLSRFLAMLPCLQTLEVENCGKVTQHLPLTKLRTLIIRESAISAISLRTLVNSCPILEHFEMHHDGILPSQRTEDDQEPFTWEQVKLELHSRRKTLKHLNLSSLFYESDSAGPGYYLGSFRDFEVLETLWVQTIGWGMYIMDTKITPTFTQDMGCDDLIDMLPESLTCLGFCGPHKKWDGIYHLVNAIRMGHFPKLKTVMVEYDKMWEFDRAQDLLADVGVVCGYLDGWLYDSFPHCLQTEFPQRGREW